MGPIETFLLICLVIWLGICLWSAFIMDKKGRSAGGGFLLGLLLGPFGLLLAMLMGPSAEHLAEQIARRARQNEWEDEGQDH